MDNLEFEEGVPATNVVACSWMRLINVKRLHATQTTRQFNSASSVACIASQHNHIIYNTHAHTYMNNRIGFTKQNTRSTSIDVLFFTRFPPHELNIVAPKLAPNIDST